MKNWTEMQDGRGSIQKNKDWTSIETGHDMDTERKKQNREIRTGQDKGLGRTDKLYGVLRRGKDVQEHEN